MLNLFAIDIKTRHNTLGRNLNDQTNWKTTPIEKKIPNT